MKIVEHTFGFIVLSLGVVAVITAKLGAGSIDAFNYYLSELLHQKWNFITLGHIVFLNGLFATTLSYIISRNKKNFISLIFVFISSVFIDLWQLAFRLIPESLAINIYFRIALAILGTLIIALGVAITITTGYPPSPFESLLVSIDQKIKRLALSKIIIDGSYLILAVILGVIYGNVFEQISYFTIVLTLLTGYLAGHFSKQIIKLKTKGVKKDVTEQTY